MILCKIDALLKLPGGGVKSFRHTYDEIISVDNLLISWKEFLRGKLKRKDVIQFSLRLMDNIFSLHNELKEKSYRHGPYHAFKINDPKPRDIHKASVRDRLIHHAVCRILYPYFNRQFIFDSYSCRIGKGTHRSIDRLRYFGGKVSRNYTRPAWALKGDIRKFFANIDHEILFAILDEYIPDEDILWLLKNVVESFHTGQLSAAPRTANPTQPPLGKGRGRVGLPLGNLTSQLLVNIYMNEFDQFVKRTLKVKYYIRYADDFVILNGSKAYLAGLIPKIAEFLEKDLRLSLHPNKLFIKTFASGVDYLGWVNFPYYRALRTTTKHRMFKRLQKNQSKQTVVSYLGLLIHGNAHKLTQDILSTPFVNIP